MRGCPQRWRLQASPKPQRPSQVSDIGMCLLRSTIRVNIFFVAPAKPVGNTLVRSFHSNLADIHEVLCTNPEDLLQQVAIQLFSQGLISKEVRNSPFDMRGSSRAASAFAILGAVEARIVTETDRGPPFKDFCAIMSKHLPLQHISARMMKGTFMFILQ